MTTANPKKANVYTKTHRSGNVTWCVNVGKKNDGKADIRNFDSESEAKNFANEWNLGFSTRNLTGLSDLSEIARHEILAAQGKLNEFGSNVSEATDFFLKHARPPKGQISILEAWQVFVEMKSGNCKPAYLRGFEKTYVMPFSRKHPERVVSDITRIEAEKYLNAHSNWSPATKASHIGYMSTFYQFLIDRGYAKLNPFQHIKKPKHQVLTAKVIKPEAVKTLLQFALDIDKKPECAAMVLVCFCGVRVQEANRLTWDKVDLENRFVKVEWGDAKHADRRVNDIPENAWEWLRLCKSIGKIAPQNYDQRMKRLRQRAGVQYPQNAMRHCFCSYHIAKHKDAARTAHMLGHCNAGLLYKTYREAVDRKDVDPYWHILPDSVLASRKKEADLADDASREEAETNSDCGKAVRDEKGQWQSVQRGAQPSDTPPE